MKISLKEAERFHGHLGPYLILGIKAGELALKELNCKKYFGLEVKVYGANKKPKSCLIDGLQLSTGATYGKGNINKFNGPLIKIDFKDKTTLKRVSLRLKNSITEELTKTKTHQGAELLAKKLYRTDCNRIFNLQPTT